MATKKIKIVRGKRLRVTRLLDCGVLPDYGAECSVVVSSGFVTVTLSAEVEEGEELTQMNANGDLCVNEQSEPQHKRWTTEIELCEVDPELLSLITNVNLETDAEGHVVGYRGVEGKVNEQFALEVWAGVGEQDCEAGTEYGYLLLPWNAGGTLGDITVENGVTTFTIENTFTRGGGGWGVGPYAVVPDAEGLPDVLSTEIGPSEHYVLRTTTIAPPDTTDGCVPMPEHAE